MGSFAASAVYAQNYLSVDVNSPQVRALRWVSAESSVLELGCGRGGVTRLLAAKRCAVTAADSDEDCRAFVEPCARAFLAVDLERREEVERLRGRYDYVLLFDILEHLSRPDVLLQWLAEVVEGSPEYLITLPNVLNWGTRTDFLLGRFRYTDRGTLDRTHLRFFTPETARELVEEAGMMITRRDRTWAVPLLGPCYGLAKLAEADRLAERVEKHASGWRGSVALCILRGIHRWNEKGLLNILDRLGRVVGRLFPSLFCDHVILAARRG